MTHYGIFPIMTRYGVLLSDCYTREYMDLVLLSKAIILDYYPLAMDYSVNMSPQNTVDTCTTEGNSDASIPETEGKSTTLPSWKQKAPASIPETEGNSNASIPETEGNSNASIPETEGNSNASIPETEGNSNASIPETEGNSNASIPETEGNSYASIPETEGNSNASIPETEGNSNASSLETEGKSTTLPSRRQKANLQRFHPGDRRQLQRFHPGDRRQIYNASMLETVPSLSKYSKGFLGAHGTEQLYLVFICIMHVKKSKNRVSKLKGCPEQLLSGCNWPCCC